MRRADHVATLHLVVVERRIGGELADPNLRGPRSDEEPSGRAAEWTRSTGRGRFQSSSHLACKDAYFARAH